MNGLLTGHYQAQLKTEKLLTNVTMTKVDRFYVKQSTNGVENYFSKSHITLGQTTGTGGIDLLEYVLVWYAPNAPLMIGAPPAELVDAFDARVKMDAPSGARTVAAWTRWRAARSLLH